MVVIEPYIRTLLPCEFSMRRNKVVISHETLKDIKNWKNYPLKKYMIKRTKLIKTRNFIKKDNQIIVHSTKCDDGKQIKHKWDNKQLIRGDKNVSIKKKQI